MNRRIPGWCAAAVGSATLVATAVLVGPAQASDNNQAANSGAQQARLVSTEPAKTVRFAVGGTQRPMLGSIDVNGDGKADRQVYCIEPNVELSPRVRSGETSLTRYDFSHEPMRDPGKVRWTLLNGYPSKDVATLVRELRIDRGTLSDQDLKITFAAATQSAVWHFSHGYEVSPGYRYDTRLSAAGRQNSAAFQAVYQFLIKHAVVVVDAGGWIIWDTKPGDPSQSVIEVPPVKPPCPPTSTSPTSPTSPTPTSPSPTPTSPKPTSPKPTSPYPPHS